MPFEIITATVTASGAILVAGATYWFTKQREREAELRKEKLEHYKEFVVSLSGIISGESTNDNQRAFALACNRLNLVAPQRVLEALQRFQEHIKASNKNQRLPEHDRLMSELFYAMRKDLGVSPDDEFASFKVGLWASGVPAVKQVGSKG